MVVIWKADNLRQQTLQQIHRILTTRQSARALLAIHDYFSRLRALSSLWLARPRDWWVVNSVINFHGSGTRIICRRFFTLAILLCCSFHITDISFSKLLSRNWIGDMTRVCILFITTNVIILSIVTQLKEFRWFYTKNGWDVINLNVLFCC